MFNHLCFEMSTLTESVSACVFSLSAAEPGGLCGLRESPQPGVPEVGQKRLRIHVDGCR